MKLVLLVVTLSCFYCIDCHPHGAPVTTCDTMFPLHKHSPSQTGPSPYISAPSETEILSNSSLVITLQTNEDSTDYSEFKGFLIMAFDQARDGVAIGTFKVDSHSHTIDCHKGYENAATHSSNSRKKRVELVWTPPANFEGTVIFKTTYVASKKIFWVKALSTPVVVKSAEVERVPMINIEVRQQVGGVVDELVQRISLWALYAFIVLALCSAVIAKIAAGPRTATKKYASLIEH